MPLTFVSHQAPVLPLKIAWPRWFDGTALVVGSMAPDLFFVAHGTNWNLDAHASVAAFAVCVPLALVVTWLIKRAVAGPLAAHLPDAGPFHLRDYGRLDAWRSPSSARGWIVLGASALVGALSHVFIDSFTHGFGWVVLNVDALRAEAFLLPEWATGRPVYVHDLLQIGGTVLGTAITIWCLHHLGRRRLIASWYPSPPSLEPTPASRRVLALATVIGLVVGLVVGALSVRFGGAQDFIIRVAAVTFVCLVIGCLGARRSMTQVGDVEPLVPPANGVEAIRAS